MIGAMPRKLPEFLHHEFSRHKKSVWYFRRGKGPAHSHPRRVRFGRVLGRL